MEDWQKTVVRMWQEGVSVKRICEAVGRTKGQLDYFLETNRDLCPCRKVYVTNDEASEMLAMWKEGSTVKKIARYIGCSESAVYYNLGTFASYRAAKGTLER